MRTNLTKSVTFSRSAAVAAATVPALRFFGAGTSQANPFDHNAAVWIDRWPRGPIHSKGRSCNSNRLYRATGPTVPIRAVARQSRLKVGERCSSTRQSRPVLDNSRCKTDFASARVLQRWTISEIE
jgi:hypothetical protein